MVHEVQCVSSTSLHVEQASSVEGLRTHVPESQINHCPLSSQSLSERHSIGLLLGNDDGLLVGEAEGLREGAIEGSSLGLRLGINDGS